MFLDYTSKYFDVSGVTLLRLNSFFLIDANIVHDRYNFLKNYQYDSWSINDVTIDVGITDQHLVALTKQFCKGVDILTLTIDSLKCTCEIDEADCHTVRLWQILNDNNQRPIFTSLKLIDGLYYARQIDEIVAKRLAVSELIIDKPQFCVINYETDAQCLVKFIDYILNTNNSINDNKEFLRVGWEFDEQLLKDMVDKFIQLKNKNKKQFAEVAKELKMIQMPYNSDGSSAYNTVKSSNSFRISTIISILELIEEINRVKANCTIKHQLKRSMCQFMGDFRINDNESSDKDWMQIVSKKIKNLMKQQIPIHVKIWVPNVTPLELIDSPFKINLDNSGTSKWYQKPICKETYGIPRCHQVSWFFNRNVQC